MITSRRAALLAVPVVAVLGCGGSSSSGGGRAASATAPVTSAPVTTATTTPVTTAATAQVASAAWTTVGGGPARTGFNAAETGRPPLSFAWWRPLAVGALSPAALQGQRAVVTGDGSVFALDVATGDVRWERAFSVAGYSGSMVPVRRTGAPTIAGDHVYVLVGDSAPDTHLWALDLDRGAASWSSAFDPGYSYSSTSHGAPLVAGDRVFFASNRQELHAVDTRTGARRWVELVGSGYGYDAWSPTLGDRHVLTNVDGVLRAHDQVAGVTSWSTTAGTSGYYTNASAPVVDGRSAYVVASGLHAIDLATQQTVWSVTGSSFSKLAVARGTVYAVDGQRLRAFEAATGNPRWTFSGDLGLNAAPVVAGDFVYVAGANRVYAVDVRSGAEVWGAAVGGQLAIGDGHLLVSTAAGDLVAYRLTR